MISSVSWEERSMSDHHDPRADRAGGPPAPSRCRRDRPHTDGIDMAEFTFAPLTPASFLNRAVAVFADRTAIVDGEHRFTYRDMSERCRRLAGALAAMGLGRED